MVAVRGESRVDAPAPAFRVRASRSLADFAEHWPRSDRVGAARCHVFQCADVLEVWLATIGPARRVRPWFVGVFDGLDAPVLLLALGIERRWGVRVLAFLDGGVADYNLPVLFEPAAGLDAAEAAGIWAAVVAALPAFDLALLDKMPAEAGGIANPLMHLAAAARGEAGHVMRLPASRAELEARMPRRRSRARHRKQLEKIGPVALMVARTQAEAETLLASVLRDKSRQLAEMDAPGFRDRPGLRAFYAAATRCLPRPAPAHLSALTVGGTLAACHWGLVFEGRFYMLVTAYADGWQRFSPGGLLHDALIRWSHEAGLSSFDFGIGNEAYKAEYCDATLPLHRATIPTRPLGHACIAGYAVASRLRALFARLSSLARPRRGGETVRDRDAG
ncbi:hypothetical protein OPKNFCMD_3906 [Methylobacterium crusticola]|uniref:BioF2-like acetyltransferase domain-containing protein n=1 Tax=Methylobacterium crusticola TaxID=1697972 RepID=A0ABQ4R2Q8_9HYPH|nr:GNAT family N-acetyltransferase [Methylobacterium crusticola]GJD51154.1 hypothetical protein OPKNFCMD_3906 [Methylobacterium crusticola]